MSDNDNDNDNDNEAGEETKPNEGAEPITIRVRDQVSENEVGSERSFEKANANRVILLDCVSPSLFAWRSAHSPPIFSKQLPSLFLLCRPAKKPFSKLKSRQRCKRCLIPMRHEKEFRHRRCDFCWMGNVLNPRKHRKCWNWTIRIKSIACWSRREVGKLVLMDRFWRNFDY